MRRIAKNLLLGSLLILGVVAALKGAALLVPSGNWVPEGTMASERSSAAAALLPDGRILVTGGDSGSGPVASADFINVDGTISAAPPMIYARSKHFAVALQDGRILVAGGITAGGSVTSIAEIFDPVANSWTNVGAGMTEARSGATAVVLQDGRVLIAGGQNGTSISSTIELFDPTLGTFTPAGMMSSPRTQYAMAALQNGRVLIVGGNNGTAPVASTDIFDPVSGTMSAGPGLAIARFGHSATTLLNGQVVVIGGNNGNAIPSQMDVTPAELFDPTAGTFTTLTANLVTPREGHFAILLPNNNNVLIVGGSSAGTAVASAELFSQWQGTFAATGTMATARSGATGAANQVNAPTSVMQRNAVVMIAGGTDASGNALSSTEAYGYPTVQTDQGDYPPGSMVTITGSGWQPGETVALSLVESPLIDTHPTFTAVADANGNIVNTQFSPDVHDIDIRFYLTAAGGTSNFQAQNTFTDATSVKTATVTTEESSCTTPAPAFNQGDTVCASVNITATNGNGGGNFFILWFSPASSTTPVRTSNPTIPGTIPATVTDSLSTAATTSFPAGTWTVKVCNSAACPGGQLVASTTFTLDVETSLALTAPSPASVPFGSTGPVSLSAAMDRIDTSAAVNGATVTFKVDGVSVGTAVTNSSGVATLSTYNPSALSVNSHNVQASFGGQTISGTTFAASTSGIATLTVNAAATSTSITSAATITYGTDGSVTVTVSSTSGTVTGNVSLTVDSTTTSKALTSGSATFGAVDNSALTKPGAGDHSLSASYAAQGNFAASGPAIGTLHVNSEAITATLTAANKNYDGTATEPDANMSCTLSGVLPGDTANVSCAATSGTFNTSKVATANLVTATVTISGSASVNYTLGAAGTTLSSTSATAAAHITTAAITTTLTAADKTYDGTATEPDASMSCTLSGVLAGDTSNVTCAATSGTFNSSQVATANLVTATATISGSAAGNYTLGTAGTTLSFTSTTATAHITTKAITTTLTAADKTYDGNATEPDASMSCSPTGVAAVDSTNVTCAATSGTFNTSQVTTANQVTATVTISGAAAANYTLGAAGTALNSTTAMAPASIKARPITVAPSAGQNKFYGDTDPTFTYSITSGNLVNGDAFSGMLGRAAGESVGTYAITQGNLSLSSNYALTFTSGVTFEIKARPITVTPNAGQHKFYGDIDPTFTYSITSGNLVNGDAFSGMLSRAAGESVGTYAITQGNLSLSTNYALTFTSGVTFEIKARPVTVAPNAGQHKFYGDIDPTFTYSITSGNLVNGDAFSGMLGRAAGESVGTYAITQGNLSLSTNYALTFTSGVTFEIKARPVTVAPNAGQHKFYGDIDPTFTYSITSGNLVNGDAFSGMLGRAAGESVGTYAITQGNLSLSTNYALTFTSGVTFEIKARPVTVTPSAGQNKFYGDTDPTFTYSITSGNLVNGDAFSGMLSRAAGESVGTYAITQSNLSLSTNYALTFTSGVTFEIKARPITVAPNAGQHKFYGDIDPTFTYSITSGNLVNGDAFSGMLSRAAGESVGTYAITQGNLSLSTNYALTFTSGVTFEIKTRPVTVTLSAANKTYDGNSTEPDANMSCSLSGVLAGDTGNVNCTATSGTFDGSNVGAHTVSATAAISGTAAGNYTLGAAGSALSSTSTSGSASITTKAITATLTAVNKIYDGNVMEANTSMSCSLTGVLSGDSAKVNCTPTSGAFNTSQVATANEVTATVTISGNAAGNYTLGAAGTTLNSTGAMAPAQITALSITVKATSISRIFGNSTPAFAIFVSVGTLVSGDTLGAPIFTTSPTNPAVNAGSYTIAVSGLANSNYAIGYDNTGTLTITQAATMTTVGSSGSPSTFGQAVTFTATVVNTQTPSTPTGSVQFKIDGVNFGAAVALSMGGTASVNSNTLSVGSHMIVAVFTNADGNFANGTSSTFTQQVNFGFVGFGAPYAPPPTTFNVTRTMPLKWQYTNSSGVVVNSAAANPVIIINGPYACNGADTTNNLITVNDAGASGYQYDPGSNSWQFNWQIKGNVVGCYDIYVKSQQSGQTNGAFPISVVNK